MPSRAEIYTEAAAGAGVQLSAERMAALMRSAHDELPRELPGGFRYSDPWFAAFMERIFGDELGLRGDALARVQRELFARFSDPATFKLYPGAFELLDGLRAASLRVGVVSNWGPRLPQLLTGLGIAERVDFVLCSGAERCEKPEPEIFRRALARAELRPEESLHAGDHPEKDVAGARRAGMAAVLVDHARRQPSGVAPKVHDLGELLLHVRERVA